MRRTTRKLHTLAVCLIAAAGPMLVAQSAGADPDTPPQLSGSAPPAPHGPSAFTFEYLIEGTSALTSALLTTHQDAALPALTGGVTLDGTAVPAGQVSSPDAGDIAVTLGELSAGTHTVTFTATVGGDTASTSSSATLSYGSSGSVVSDPVAFVINQPDLYTTFDLPTQPGAASAQADRQAEFTASTYTISFLVGNNGWGRPETTIELKVPHDLKLVSIRPYQSEDFLVGCDYNRRHDVVCDAGAFSHQRVVQYVAKYRSTPEQRIGHAVAATVTVGSGGPDTNPKNNTAARRILLLGPAAVVVHMSIPHGTTRVGDKVAVTVWVHNRGPYTAVHFRGVVSGDAQHFGYVSFSGNGVHNPDAAPPSAVTWTIGSLRPGHSRSAVYTVRATHKTTANRPATLNFAAFARNVNPRCPDNSCGTVVGHPTIASR